MGQKGLTDAQVEKLRLEFGKNALPTKGGTPLVLIFLAQFKSPLIYILVIIAIISFLFQKYIDVALIISVVLLNSFMGFFQEYRAQKTLVALRNILKPKIIAIRNGQRKEIEISELVPGDIVVIGSGDKIPADGVLIEGVNLLVSEAILTGEEEAIEKTIAKEKSALFMGTTIISGRGVMKVEKIGRQTAMGKIEQGLKQIKELKTPIQIKLEELSKNLAKIILIICSLLFLVGLFYGVNIVEMFRFSVVLVIAAIPEGLPVVITIILALGMRRILKRQGLVKKLISIETLGSASVICTDKTGTLTQGNMSVVKTDYLNKEKALIALALANDQRTNIDTAIWQHIKNEADFKAQKVFDSSKRIYEEPFDSEKKYIFTINKINGSKSAFMVGAPEIILSFCKNLKKERDEIIKKTEQWAQDGLKVIGVASKEERNLKERKDFLWLGLLGIQDPIRKEAKEAVLRAQEAGIKVKIVTGDYSKTAEKIASSLGFKLKLKNIIEGQELENISENELQERIDDILLFSRVTPQGKQKIIKVLQQKGEVVAMTGDGVNDALALKEANIGVVVGNGSEVAKEAGDLILLDNNFKTIVAAVEEGRTIFSNIKKVVAYILSNSFVEIFLIFGSMLFGLPYPLTVGQILWVHIICDGPPDIMLGFEPKEKDIMKRKPQNLQKEEILSNPLKFLILSISFIIGAMCLAIFWYIFTKTHNLELARTLTFVCVATVDLFYVFSFKNLKKSIFKSGNFFENKFLFWGVVYGFVLTFGALYLPFLNKILTTTPLGIYYWVIILGVALISIIWIELFKFFYSKSNL